MNDLKCWGFSDPPVSKGCQTNQLQNPHCMTHIEDSVGNQYHQTRYVLRILEAEASLENSLLEYRSTSPFPRYQTGDLFRTVEWNLKQEGKLAVVDRVLHTVSNATDTNYIQQDVFCRFETPIFYGAEAQAH